MQFPLHLAQHTWISHPGSHLDALRLVPASSTFSLQYYFEKNSWPYRILPIATLVRAHPEITVFLLALVLSGMKTVTWTLENPITPVSQMSKTLQSWTPARLQAWPTWHPRNVMPLVGVCSLVLSVYLSVLVQL